MDELEADWMFYLNQFENAQSFEDAFYALIKLDTLQRMFMSIAALSEIRHTMNTKDKYYRDEEAYMDSIKPLYEELINRRNKVLLKSPYKDELKKLVGNEFFSRIETNSKSFSNDILEDLKEENKLSAKYTVLTANIEGSDGQRTYSMAELGPLMNSKDRNIRRKYTHVFQEAYATIGDELDVLFDELVKVRHSIASKLGMDSFTDVGYSRMGRTSYDRDDMLIFRKEVENELVPLVYEVFNIQRERLGVDILYSYDEYIDFPDGNIIPKVGVAELVDVFNDIFSEMSPETKMFYQDLVEGQFYDLDIRKGKIMGAYSKFLPLFNIPFVFGTFNNTPGAVRTFAHECGHGLYSYLMRGEIFVENTRCSSDLAEIHSMAMEFFIWPWLDKLFDKKDVNKYKYSHIKQALSFIPYGTAVDEFQHRVYDNPNMTPEERRMMWQELEQRYLPWRNYDGDNFFSQGRIWQKQTHIYKWPFYYIDYVLAQTCALQYHFLRESQPDEAFISYLKLLKASSRHSFSDAISLAGLKSPFEKGMVRSLASDTRKWLNLLNI